MLADKKCKAYVVRKLYRYVSVWKAKDSADYAIEFVPTWKNDNRVYKRIISGSANGDLTWEDNKAQPLIVYDLGQHKEVARVFTGDIVRAKKDNAPFRFYRVLAVVFGKLDAEGPPGAAGRNRPCFRAATSQL